MWQRLKELLNQTETSTSGQPAIHKVLDRSSASREAYAAWKYGDSVKETMEWLWTNYNSQINGGRVDRTIAFLDTPSKKGFVFYLMDRAPETGNPEHLMDYLKERMIGLGYNLYTSDLKSYSAGDEVETQQRHYLKPPLNFVPNKKLSQLFGNISIEYILRNNEPYMFKFSATTYQDYMFEDPNAFEQLMKELCTT